MTSQPASQPGHHLPEQLLLAFAPLHKAAFGAAIGVACGLLVFAVTAVTLIRHTQGMVNLYLLSAYFRGYSVSWTGALVGAVWAGFAGFVFGWFFAFCRNLIMAISLFVLRTRSEIARTRDFLDHV